MKSVVAILNAFFPDRKVRNGPFQGLQYLDFDLYQSHIFPQLIGSFEMELKGVINQILNNKYSSIINIGSGQGYYSIGLARYFKTTPVVAFDMDPLAQFLCTEMATLNSVNEIVSVKGRCDQNSLLNLPLKNALVICDCEGYEDILFSNESISNFYNCELLIETHDCFVKNVAANLKNRFKNSHKITSVMSIDDEKKAITYEFNELNGINLTTKKMLLAEKRKAKMEWLFLQPFSIKKT